MKDLRKYLAGIGYVAFAAMLLIYSYCFLVLSALYYLRPLPLLLALFVVFIPIVPYAWFAVNKLLLFDKGLQLMKEGLE